jgi:hypothetical protein
MARSKPKGPSSEVIFTDPPEKNARYDWEAIAQTLRAHPNQWALIFERDKTSVANTVRYGFIAVLHPDLGFEYRTANNVKVPSRMCSFYMRFVPGRGDSLREAVTTAKKGT